MLRNRMILAALTGVIVLFMLTACGSAFRGDPVLPKEVVDAIAKESVKFFAKEAPEGSLLVETAKLETFWGQLVGDDVEKYADVICFKAGIKYIYNGIELITYYQGLVKKPGASGTPWFVDDVSLDVWNQYSCGGEYLVRVTPTAAGE